MARDASILALCLWAGAAQADAYNLTVGDRLAVSLVGAEQTYEIEVDIDGEIRFVDVGGIDVAGMTLDETEGVIEGAIEAAGLFVDPQATVSILRYAPIVVAGEVVNPGRYDYLPQMTVATALGLSGGSQFTGISRFEVERAQTEVAGQLRNLNLEIIATAVEIARFSAEIEGGDAPVIADDLLAAIPRPDPERTERFLADAAAIVANNRARADALLALWDEEIATLEQQGALLDERIEVQRTLAASLAEDLATARDLQSRGLQTQAALSRSEQMESEARSRALELESLLVAIQRNVAEARRGREQFVRARREDALLGLRAARVAFDDLRLRYARNLEQEAILSGGTVASLLAADLSQATFRLISARPGRGDMGEVTPATVMLPGDTLIVNVEAQGLGTD